jgi:hypothetical protein
MCDVFEGWVWAHGVRIGFRHLGESYVCDVGGVFEIGVCARLRCYLVVGQLRFCGALRCRPDMREARRTFEGLPLHVVIDQLRCCEALRRRPESSGLGFCLGDIARLPPARRAFRAPAGAQVTFLCWPKEK